ncbi:MAG: class I SAM-dependent methyltransferase [Nitrospina sp.]|nr:class I SAM-dependent methyltransferase [Nitrospina sp.]
MQPKVNFPNPVCSLCGKESQKVVFENVYKNNQAYDVIECLSCQVWFTHPIPSTEELSKLYSTGNYRAKTGKRFIPILEKIIHFLTMRKRNRIKKYMAGGRILDIGCGRGLFLNLMKKDGWLVAGQEFDEKSASYAVDNYGIDVHTGSLQGKFESESFDVVNINHVLEHLENPEKIIAECNRILKRGGLLVIAVPNIDSLQAKFGERKWFQLDIPCHLYHFSSSSIVKLIESNFFKVDLVRHFKLEYNPFGWLQTMLNVLGIHENHLYDMLKSSELKSNEKGNFPLSDNIKSFFLVPLCLPLSFIFSIIEAMFKKGGTVEIYSLKNN